MITRFIRPSTLARLSLLTCCSLLALAQPALARTYYVSGAGSDSQNGLTPKTAFRSLQHAADLTRPGDVVNAMNGTYSNARSGASVLYVATSGTPDAWITYRAFPGQKPVVTYNGWNGISFDPKVAYIVLRGFTVIGNNYRLTLEDALKQGKVGDPVLSGNCIEVDGRKGTPTLRPHHIKILNNSTSACGGVGIGTIQADYITIADNVIYDSAWYSIYGCSGISLLENWNSDKSTGYKMIVTGNRVYGNKELVPWVDAGKITDGEGIILDTSRSPNIGDYTGRTLVANNILYGNGSAAIEAFRSDHIDIFNNSTYADSVLPVEADRGELNLNDVADVNIANNIFYSGKGQDPVSINVNKPCKCTFSSNVYYNGPNKPAELGGAHDLYADPRYFNPDQADRATVDLRLKAGSPARASGNPALAPPRSLSGKPNQRRARIDRGAYQH